MTTNYEFYNLQTYGWSEYWNTILSQVSQEHEVIQKLSPARVIAQFSHSYKLITSSGEHSAGVSGKLEFNAINRSDYPAVGDWVMVEMLPNEARSVIHAILPRRTYMVRKAAGNTMEDQIIGSNMDYIFIVNALNQDFNLRKIERYLIAAWESGAQPVVLLTKADLCNEPTRYMAEVMNAAPGVPVHLISALQGMGMDDLSPYLLPGITIAITGSSGVGKSTLLNWLAESEKQRVQEIREDDARGRHTTTHRELFLLPSGALIMDTPGMRELQLWDSQDGWEQAFSDIEELTGQCRYTDCKHELDQGCAIIAALNEGSLDAKRYANYKKTAKELAHLARKESVSNQKRTQRTTTSVSKKKRSRPSKNELLEDMD